MSTVSHETQDADGGWAGVRRAVAAYGTARRFSSAAQEAVCAALTALDGIGGWTPSSIAQALSCGAMSVEVWAGPQGSRRVDVRLCGLLQATVTVTAAGRVMGHATMPARDVERVG